jgi:ADP-dependent NAD(P)H-hydrate dehydratase / NAD(P)H-hydrate epimerase
VSSVLLNAQQMRAADQLTIASGTPGAVLMQRAGEAVVREIKRRFTPRPVTVLCGPGNNGGDGFVVALELSKHAWPVRVALLGAKESLSGDALWHAQHWTGAIEPMSPAAIEGAQLVVDAIFGSGLNRRMESRAVDTLAYAVRSKVPLIAVDIPSGVAGDSGEAHGAAAAVCTVTFMRKKAGHLLLPGRSLCGELVVADIGIPAGVLESIPVDTWENGPGLWCAKLPHPQSTDNKYSRGHALLYGGYPMTGAARMAARAAARSGSGLTSIAVPENALAIYAAALSSIMVQPLAKDDDFARLLADPRYSAFSIGPGAGVNEATRARALAMLATGRPVVIDADAISVFSAHSDELFCAIRGPCVMTPHDGEFKRIFETHGDKLTRTRAAARRSGAVIVLKGPDTVIAAPDGRACINANAPATLATAGAGDVLGGIILGLMAQGMDAFPAAAAGVWMHGAAAGEFGPGLLAEDLPDLLPAVWRRLEQIKCP